MKKLFLSAAALLLCLSALSLTADFSAIARLEGNHREEVPGQPVPGLNFANSSLYTHFTSDFSEHFSFELFNLWLNDNTRDLYMGTLRSDMASWMQVCTIKYAISGFSATVGKQFINAGGFEADNWDYDIDFDLCSQIWNLPISEWGVALGYTLPSEKSSFALQALASPYGKVPFSSGLWCFTAEWRGDFGPLHTRWTAAAMGTERKRYEPFLTAAQNIDLGDCWNIGAEYHWYNGSSVIGTIDFNPSARWEIFAKGGYEASKGHYYKESEEYDFSEEKGWYAGASLRFYPLKDSRKLRIHANGSYRSLTGYSFTLGATFDLNIFSIKSK